MPHSKKIIVFGTTELTEIFINNEFYEVAYIIDNIEEKWGKRFFNKLVYNPEKIKEEKLSEIQILLAFSPSGFTNKMVSNQLKDMGLIEDYHFMNIYDILPSSYPYQKISPLSTYAPWQSDTDFQYYYNVIKDRTLVDIYRCYELWKIIEQVSELEGALIEIGVWKGGTGGLIAKKSELCGIKDSVYLCDTFSGVVKANPIHDNVYIGGEHSDTNEKLVKDLVHDQLQLSNVKVLKGIFPNDTEFLIKDQLFRFCHIDVDVYDSAKDIFEWVWDRMIIGGIVVFDDYGFITCQGVTKYVNELRENKDNILIHNLNGHGVFIKIK